MRIIVCVKQLSDGQLNPFDASALEMALGICSGEDSVTILSMGRQEAGTMLAELTRLGNNVSGVLLSDPAFAGADTYVTARTLSAWLKRQEFSYIFCGRQSIDGETGQVGPEIAQMLGMKLVPEVMEIHRSLGNEDLEGRCRSGERIRVTPGTLLTAERAVNLRFPSLWSTPGQVTALDHKDLKIAQTACGLAGSPTQVIASYEKENRRHCRKIAPKELPKLINELQKQKRDEVLAMRSDIMKASEADKLEQIWITDPVLLEQAKNLAHSVKILETKEPENIEEQIKREAPDAILFPADWKSRNIASGVAARLGTGLCADCTELMADKGELHMIRPAFGGKLFAKIRCRTRPAMATVRILPPEKDREALIFAVGKGALSWKSDILEMAKRQHGSIAASRGAVETGEMPYEYQVGLTGKTVAPEIYVMLGISGAVHHVVGMETSQTVIAVNTDPDADVFDYADYGIVCSVEEILHYL